MPGDEHRALLPTLVVKLLFVRSLLRIPANVSGSVPSFHRLGARRSRSLFRMTSTGDLCLIPSRSGGRAASTSGAPTSGFRSSRTSGTWVGKSTSGIASSLATFMKQYWCHANWRPSHLSCVDLSFRSNSALSGFVDQINYHHNRQSPVPADHFQNRLVYRERTFFETLPTCRATRLFAAPHGGGSLMWNILVPKLLITLSETSHISLQG